MDKLWTGFGTALAKPESIALPAPAVAFWVGGLAAWTWDASDATVDDWIERFGELSSVLQAGLLVIAMFVVVGSGLVVGLFELPVLRLIEGYWPRWARLQPLREAMVRRQNRRLDAAEDEWQALAAKETAALSRHEQEELAALDLRLRLAPPDPVDRMPTALGNILRAAESRSRAKYGLDAIVCWPRLWLLLPESAQQDVTRGRADLDLATRILIWGALFLVWSVFSLWAVAVAVVAIIAAYRRMVRAATAYGDLLEAAFDLHRFALYDALHWPRPVSTASEVADGQRLTEYLFRGTVLSPVVYAPASDCAAERIGVD